MIDGTNTTANYNRHHTRDICAAIHSLSPERKQYLLDEIQLQKGIGNLTEQSYNLQNCAYIESLLNGKRPKNGISR